MLMAKKATDTRKEKPKIEYNDRTIQSYIKNNIEDIPHQVLAPDERIKKLIHLVDLTKPFGRKIMTMTRFRPRDMDSPGKHVMKEFLTYLEEWNGHNWLGEKLRNNENCEGVDTEVETVPIVKFNNETGRSEVTGQKISRTHLKYYIPFSKEKVDEIIARSDSDKDEITYVVKSPPCRDHFTYDEFVNFTWEQLDEILMTDGGAKMARAERIKQLGLKVLTANNTLNFKPS